MFWFFRPISVFETTAIIRTSKFTVFTSGSFCQIYRVTDEALIAETMVWPNFFLMDVFFALKGSKLFTIMCMFCAYTRPRYQMSVYRTIDPLVLKRYD